MLRYWFSPCGSYLLKHYIFSRNGTRIAWLLHIGPVYVFVSHMTPQVNVEWMVKRLLICVDIDQPIEKLSNSTQKHIFTPIACTYIHSLLTYVMVVTNQSPPKSTAQLHQWILTKWRNCDVVGHPMIHGTTDPGLHSLRLLVCYHVKQTYWPGKSTGCLMLTDTVVSEALNGQIRLIKMVHGDQGLVIDVVMF
jgi:hypothetical protein